MRHLAFSAFAVLALTAACKDQPRQSPTEPSSEASAAIVQAPLRDGAGESTLCAAYRTRLGESRAELARSKGDESLRERIATYEAVIADACP